MWSYPIDRQCGGSIADCARWTPDQRHWCHVSPLLLARKIKSLRIDYEYARLPLDSLLAHPISLAITYLRHNFVACANNGFRSSSRARSQI